MACGVARRAKERVAAFDINAYMTTRIVKISKQTVEMSSQRPDWAEVMNAGDPAAVHAFKIQKKI